MREAKLPFSELFPPIIHFLFYNLSLLNHPIVIVTGTLPPPKRKTVWMLLGSKPGFRIRDLSGQLSNLVNKNVDKLFGNFTTWRLKVFGIFLHKMLYQLLASCYASFLQCSSFKQSRLRDTRSASALQTMVVKSCNNAQNFISVVRQSNMIKPTNNCVPALYRCLWSFRRWLSNPARPADLSVQPRAATFRST